MRKFWGFFQSPLSREKLWLEAFFELWNIRRRIQRILSQKNSKMATRNKKARWNIFCSLQWNEKKQENDEIIARHRIVPHSEALICFKQMEVHLTFSWNELNLLIMRNRALRLCSRLKEPYIKESFNSNKALDLWGVKFQAWAFLNFHPCSKVRASVRLHMFTKKNKFQDCIGFYKTLWSFCSVILNRALMKWRPTLGQSLAEARSS